MTVNMHRLGESFVEKVTDVRRRVTVDGKVTAPGESMEFLALIQGWQSEARRERRERLLKLNDIGLRIALEHATVKDVFFIPEVHFAEKKPMLADDDGWWYQVRSVIWCRTCGKCRVRDANYERAVFQRICELLQTEHEEHSGQGDFASRWKGANGLEFRVFAELD